MVTTFIEFSDQLVIIQDNQNATYEMAAIQITISSQLQTQFSQRHVKIYKNINEVMKKCLKMVPNFSEFLFLLP